MIYISMRREIKVNFGMLQELADKLKKYEDAIIDMDKSLKIIEKTAEENKGEAFEKLRNIKNNVSASLKGSSEEVSDLNRILNKYITSMTSIISPEIKSDMMLVR